MTPKGRERKKREKKERKAIILPLYLGFVI